MASGLAAELFDQAQGKQQGRAWALAGDAVAIHHHRLIDKGAATEAVTEGRVAGHAPLLENAITLQSQRWRGADGGEQQARPRLLLHPLGAWLLVGQALGTGHAP